MADHPLQRVESTRIIRGQQAFHLEQQVCTSLPAPMPEMPERKICELRRYTAHMPDIWVHQIYRRFHDGLSLEINRRATDPVSLQSAESWRVAQVMINLGWDLSSRLLGYLHEEVKGDIFRSGQHLRSSGLGQVEVSSRCLKSGALAAVNFLYIGRGIVIEIDDPEILLGFLGKIQCPPEKPAKPVDSRLAGL